LLAVDLERYKCGREILEVGLAVDEGLDGVAEAGDLVSILDCSRSSVVAERAPDSRPPRDEAVDSC
jgi:hypothetical protein